MAAKDVSERRFFAEIRDSPQNADASLFRVQINNVSNDLEVHVRSLSKFGMTTQLQTEIADWKNGFRILNHWRENQRLM